MASGESVIPLHSGQISIINNDDSAQLIGQTYAAAYGNKLINGELWVPLPEQKGTRLDITSGAVIGALSNVGSSTKWLNCIK